jgi:hypothetical protein
MEVGAVSSEFDEFDLDIRFGAGPISEHDFGGPAKLRATELTCIADCDPDVRTKVFQCEHHPERTVVEQECAGLDLTISHTCPESCDRVLCMEREPATLLYPTCGDTCAPQATCPAKTCGLDCETDTCPDATCGCNTSETCNRDLCEGGQITSPPCQDDSDADDTCDACPGQSNGCGTADTDNCVKTSDC